MAVGVKEVALERGEEGGSGSSTGTGGIGEQD